MQKICDERVYPFINQQKFNFSKIEAQRRTKKEQNKQEV